MSEGGGTTGGGVKEWVKVRFFVLDMWECYGLFVGDWMLEKLRHCS